MHLLFFYIIAILLGVNVDASPGTVYNSIFFNNGEIINYSVIENYGIEGINYLKYIKPQYSAGDTSIGPEIPKNDSFIYCYSYKSIFAESTIIRLDYYYSNTPKISLIGDTSENLWQNTLLVFKSELNWLKEKSIISFDSAVVNMAINSMCPRISYWTYNKSTLPNNQSFKYDFQSNQWSSEIVVAKSLGSTEVNIEFPPEPLKITQVIRKTHCVTGSVLNSAHNLTVDLAGRCLNWDSLEKKALPAKGVFVKTSTLGSGCSFINIHH